MEAKAQARYVRVTPQKARRVVNEVRGKAVLEAADILRFAPQAVATDVRKVLLSAVANSKVKAEAAGETFNEAELQIIEAFVDEGPTMKRFRPRAHRPGQRGPRERRRRAPRRRHRRVLQRLPARRPGRLGRRRGGR